MHIIPAIDIIGGNCVRLEKGDYSKQKTYDTDPLAVARSFEEVGIERLHLVDLDGAKSKHVVNLNTLESISQNTNLKVDFGGGVKSDADVEKVFAAGAQQVTGGSIAARDNGLFLSWVQRYGAEKIILGADVLDKKVMVSGWQEGTSLELDEFLTFYLDRGLQYVICTDISKDGMLAGPAFDLYHDILAKYPTVKLIASGGVSHMEDLHRLRDLGLFAAIVGKAIYENKITLEDISQF